MYTKLETKLWGGGWFNGRQKSSQIIHLVFQCYLLPAGFITHRSGNEMKTGGSVGIWIVKISLMNHKSTQVFMASLIVLIVHMTDIHHSCLIYSSIECARNWSVLLTKLFGSGDIAFVSSSVHLGSCLRSQNVSNSGINNNR